MRAWHPRAAFMHSHALTCMDAHACALKSAACINRVWFLVVIGNPRKSALLSILRQSS